MIYPTNHPPQSTIYPSQVVSSLQDINAAILVTKGADSLSPLMAVKTQTSALNFANTLAQTYSEQTVAFVGAKVGDLVEIQPATKSATVIYTGDVVTDGVVTVRLNNFSGSAVNPASMDYVIRLTPMTFN